MGSIQAPTTQSLIPICSWTVLLLVLHACANPITPDGGPRDTQPPQVDTTVSTPNFQVNFEKQPIELTFDEWVTLTDVFNQVLISPPLEYDPDISLKKRTVTVTFDEREELRESATYSIQFGEAVKDLNEGNPAEDLRFVFSTGPVLDSLRVRGILSDAQTGEPVEDALFLLYENTADSVVRTDRPFYFGKTGSEGRFLIKNVKEGQFKGFALVDQNLNYRYDQQGEVIGFPDSLLTVAPGNEPNLNLRMFVEDPPLSLDRTLHDAFGLVRLGFNQPVYSIEPSRLGEAPDTLLPFPEGDTMRLYYDQGTNTDWEVLLTRDTAFRDTVRIEALDREAFTANTYLLETTGREVKSQRIASRGEVRWTFDRPLASLDTNRIDVVNDSSEVVRRWRAVIDSLDPRRMVMDVNWAGGRTYSVTLLPGAVSDWYGRTTDTLTRTVSVGTAEDFGNILLTVDALDSTQQYVMELIMGERVMVREIIRDQSRYSATYDNMAPGNYTVRLVEDRNRNSRWDTGNYETRTQPEPIQTRGLEQLRANWDLEATVSWTPNNE